MEKFKYYGELEKVIKGTGVLRFADQKKYDVSYEIAKRGEEKLLFNAITKDIKPFESYNLLKSGKAELLGEDLEGRTVEATGLLIKDIEGGSIINGYVQKCEIGEKELKDGYTAHFGLINFLFHGNEAKVKETEKGKKYTKPILQLQFPDFDCSIKQIEDYSITKQLLKRQGGVLKTSTLIAKVNSQNDYESIHEKVRKLCQLLSVARSTFINWSTCKIEDTDGNVIYELHGNRLTRPFHGNNLINDLPQGTVRFLESAWKAYDKYYKTFDLERFLYGYADTYMNSFIETRSLNIAVLVDNISSKWAINEGRENFLDEKIFTKYLPKLRKGIQVLLEIVFDKINKSYVRAMLSKVAGFNRRPLDWKLKRFRKTFRAPIKDEEIERFVYIRDSLAHSSLFPDDMDSKKAFLFMRHLLDRVVLSVLGYEGKYFDMENREEKTFE